MKTQLIKSASKKFLLAAGISSIFAGTLFADVSAFRRSSGTYTNSADTVYVGNTVWGADTKAIGEKYFADVYAKRGYTFSWDAEKEAFFKGNSQSYSSYNPFTGAYESYTYSDYMGFDAVFALEGSASFVNDAGAELTFSYSGDKLGDEDDYDSNTGKMTYSIYNENVILLAGSSKFTNKGTISCTTEYTGSQDAWYYNEAPDFSFYLRDNAVFENSGTVEGEWFGLFGNSKLINKKGGILGNLDLSLYENAVFENAGTVTSESGWSELDIGENAKVVNTGTFDTKLISFSFVGGYLAGTARFENYGEMTNAYVDFLIESNDNGVLPTNLSASFENYGTIELDASESLYGSSRVEFVVEKGSYEDVGDYEGFRTTIAKSNFNVKNFGTITTDSDSAVCVSSGVKLTLGEGSRINGNLAIGTAIEYFNDYETGNVFERHFRVDKDELNIVLTGKGGSDALISGDLEVCSIVDLNVSFADDAVQKTKYVLTIWGGEVSFNCTNDETDGNSHPAEFIESSLSGTLSKFGTTYNWSLDTTTGVLIAKDAGIVEEITITSSSQSVPALGAKDIATFDSGLTEFSGSVSGSGLLESCSDLEFKGDAIALTGTFSVNAGTLTLAEDAKLGGAAALDIEGTLLIEGKRSLVNTTSGNGEISLASGSDVSFTKSVGVETLSVRGGATLRGNVSMTHKDAELALAGTLVLNADNGEKISLGGGSVKLVPGALLNLIGNSTKARAVSQIAALENGTRISIFENGTVDGDEARAFLETDFDLMAYAQQYAVVYSTGNGLSVQVIKDASALTASVAIPDDLRDAAEIVLEEVELNLDPGLKTLEELSGSSSGDLLADAILNDPTTAGEMVVNILPVHYAAMVAMTTEAFHTDVRSIANRLDQRRYDGYSAAKKYEFFFQLQGNSVDNDNSLDSPTFDYDTFGFLAGADYKITPSTILGLAVGAEFGDADIHNDGGKLEMSDMRLTGFVGQTIANQFYVNAGAQVGSGAFDIKRKTVWGDPRGDATTVNVGGFVEAGTLLQLTNSIFATPYVGLAYMYTYVDDFKEEGMGAIWEMDSFYGNSLRARVGCGLSWGFNLADCKWRLGMDVAYSHDFLGEDVDVEVKGDFPTMKVKAMPTDLFSVGPTLNVNLSDRTAVYAGYTFSAGTDSTTRHNANLGVRLWF